MRISDWSSDVCSSDLPAPVLAWFRITPFAVALISPHQATLPFTGIMAEKSACVLPGFGRHRRRIGQSPHPLKIVKAAHFRAEQVNADVTCIDQYPVGCRTPLNTSTSAGLLFDSFRQLLTHGCTLPGHPSRPQHHIT